MTKKKTNKKLEDTMQKIEVEKIKRTKKAVDTLEDMSIMIACEEEKAIKEFKDKGFSESELEIIHRWWLQQNKKDANTSLLNQPTTKEKIKQIQLPKLSPFYKMRTPKSH